MVESVHWTGRGKDAVEFRSISLNGGQELLLQWLLATKEKESPSKAPLYRR